MTAQQNAAPMTTTTMTCAERRQWLRLVGRFEAKLTAAHRVLTDKGDLRSWNYVDTAALADPEFAAIWNAAARHSLTTEPAATL